MKAMLKRIPVLFLVAACILTVPASAVDANGEEAPDKLRHEAIFEGYRSYQRPGGDIRFTLTSAQGVQPTVILACLRWKLPQHSPANAASSTTATADTLAPPVAVPNLPGVATETECPSENDQAAAGWPLNVRTIKVDTDRQSVTYAVTIPRGFSVPVSQGVERNELNIPIAELDVYFYDGGLPRRARREVGVTNVWMAAAAATVAVLVALWGLYRFALFLKVPGPEGNPHILLKIVRGYSVPLRVISTASGWASLSQLQIVLWTFVVGAGAVYVMALTGSLITISSGTLMLLGIAGGATVLAEVKANQQAQTSGSADAPEMVTGLTVADAGSSHPEDVLLSWNPTARSATPTSYIVQYTLKAQPSQWRTATSTREGVSLLCATAFRLVGLADGDYLVRVIGVNKSGWGAPCEPVGFTIQPTLKQNARPSAGIDPSGIARTSTQLVVPLPADGLSHDIQFRPHDGDEDWKTAAVATDQAKVTLGALSPSTVYDIRVRAKLGSGNDWSPIATAETAQRVPRWSDIVTDTDRPAEIDVTRVQMLFFTVISAVFVGVNIVDTGTIPDIDATYVTLMGISNGVYVSAKFVRS